MTSTTWPKSRKVGFYASLTLATAVVMVTLGPPLLGVVLFWTDGDLVQSLFGSDFAHHRFHGFGIAIVAWIILLGLVVQFRQPLSKPATLWLTLAVLVGFIAASALTGRFEAEPVVVAVAVVTALFLHPTALHASWRPFDRPTAALVTIGAAGWVVYGVGQAQLQVLSSPSESHAALGHYATMVVLTFVMSAGAWLCATSLNGFRPVGFFIGAGATMFGLTSLIYAGLASTVGPVGSIAAILWGIGIVVAVAVRKPTTARADQPADPHQAHQPA